MSGICLQRIQFTPELSEVDSFAVASQWLSMPGREPVWILEHPCWDGIDLEHLEIWEIWQSDSYLVIKTADSSTGCRSLYVWHFTSLHRPPRTIISHGERIHGVEMYGDWIIYQPGRSTAAGQDTVCVYDLAKSMHYSDVLSSSAGYHITHATASSAYIVVLRCNPVDGPVPVTYMLWQISSGQAAPFQHQAAGKVVMEAKGGGVVDLKRIDKDRFILWAPCFDEPDPALPPTIVLVEVIDGAAGVSLVEKWTRSLEIYEVRPIVSRNLLAANNQTLLSLSDGSVVCRVDLDCWRLSGLYPHDDQWSGMTVGVAEQNLDNGAILGVHQETLKASSPTARFYIHEETYTVIDYTGYTR
ncbi:hypothetical protein THASP1DRAFT_32893 [Thamnocephalis sphaerospora]|uniref:Uncharacterized protein n=1 Tax=Thamnocephalis sphaerospora TaxID=78915 RepID=A0A4V1IVU4_9FUNG|nr:hypothetical protein THASP1DRAFT_32893 [Thamnocephalis sphaerospora]|eukprot:RKP05269.1 hypothetical protein THASP1DRAFT_32893 [Thamnocephalis sphaerospora]